MLVLLQLSSTYNRTTFTIATKADVACGARVVNALPFAAASETPPHLQVRARPPDRGPHQNISAHQAILQRLWLSQMLRICIGIIT